MMLSVIQESVDICMLRWTEQNDMKINFGKIKRNNHLVIAQDHSIFTEALSRRYVKDSMGGIIAQVCHAKLLSNLYTPPFLQDLTHGLQTRGLHHCEKGWYNACTCYMQLKRAGITQKDLVSVYVECW